MIGDPAGAAPRPDLVFLRRRSRPRPAPVHPPTNAASSGAVRHAASGSIDYTRPDRSRPAATSQSPAGSGGGIDFTRPDRSGSQPAPSSASLDLSGPTPPASAPSAPARPATGSASLDLSGPTPPASAPSAPAPAPVPAPVLRSAVRVGGHDRLVLDVRTPTVTLTRVQSGIGQLVIEAVCSAEVGDLRLGAAYQFRSGTTSTLAHASGQRVAPPNSRRPLLLGAREEFERISVDLRQIDELERVAIYAFSESRAELTWAGTLRLMTFGGARVELPLESLYAGRAAVLMTLYNVDGELVVRAEMETIAGDVREAARAYGYDRITWRDDRLPVD